MTTRAFLYFLFVFHCNIALGQVSEGTREIAGKYTSRNPSHTNHKHYEEIILGRDSTFIYFSRIGSFIIQKIEGRWTIKEKYLVLNENDLEKKESVVSESYNPAVPKGWIKFSVQHFDDSFLNYGIAAVNGDTTIILKNQFASSLLPLTSIEEFYVEGLLFRYPTHRVEDQSTNYFVVKVSSKRHFIDEKWLIEGSGRIRPIGLDNQYAGYFLSKDVKDED